MGALHAGHLALVKRAQRRADRVIVSIFVNPTQFAPNEDLKTYPRTFDADVAALRRLSADLVWAPSAETMYPAGFATRVVPGARRRPASKMRSGRIFSPASRPWSPSSSIQCGPDVATFGEKDYQQLKVVTQLARDLDLKTRIVAVPTVREADGLALVFAQCLPLARRTGDRAGASSRACRIADKIAAGHPIAAVADRRPRGASPRPGSSSIIWKRATPTRSRPPLHWQEGPLRLLVAARLGKTRLIDNIAV